MYNTLQLLKLWLMFTTVSPSVNLAEVSDFIFKTSYRKKMEMQ